MAEELDEKKLRLFCGQDNWHTLKDPASGLRSLVLSDGPNGLRIEQETGIGFLPSKEAVCYPAASLVACSFDRDLLKEQGDMLALDCLEEGVDVLLGPGVNHKRSPLCGRNFEYYSEDPILSSELGIAYINGVQAHGIGTSLKHYAANSREKGRLVQDSIVDERTLHELYLRQFERIMKEAKPWSVMAAYNKLNGIHCTENRYLLQDLARDKWGYRGIFVSDWGAVHDPVASVKNGLNLQMPGGHHGIAARLQRALRNKEISEADIKENLSYLEAGLKSLRPEEKKEYDLKAHLDFARHAAEQSAVLLKNEGILPLKKTSSIALVGAFAKHPRYQGTGSSKVNSVETDSIHAAMEAAGYDFTYAEGYHPELDMNDLVLVQQAIFAAKEAETVIVVAGLPDRYEAEGYDRRDMSMPENQNYLIKELAKVNPNIVVVLQCGAPVEMPWLDQVKGLLYMGLSGCQGGAAAVNLLSGNVNPSGRLAETWPLKLQDTPCYQYFTDDLRTVEYREALFSGYRYYTTMQVPVCYPFGYGLSYTTFRYDRIDLQKDSNGVQVSVQLTNTGTVSGREVVQIYVSLPKSRIVRPLRELKGFASINLQPQESGTVTIRIPYQDLAYYDVQKGDWALEAGTYCFAACASAAEVRLQANTEIAGVTDPYSRLGEDYIQYEDGIVTINRMAFEQLAGHPIPTWQRPDFDVDTTVDDLAVTGLGRRLHRLIRRILRQEKWRHVEGTMVFEAPVRSLFMLSRRVTWDTLDVVLDMFRHGFFRNLFRLRRTLYGGK
ncbi:MAG: glycoside hydrolase family 3 C-terminal domain-containing protein [Solobacterium sp.]|nr:glycoside hydrolase family 3 C-terminal domain-containing protein [Solobacterium sp.]